MINQTSILIDAELEHVVGGKVDTPVFRTVLDNSAASQIRSRAPSASVGEMKSLQVGRPIF